MIENKTALLLALNAIKALANEGCKFAKTIQNDLDKCLNWGDLSCVEVAFNINEAGEESIVVYIEEADHNSPKLQSFMRDYIRHRVPGDLNIDVVTEW